jgi:flagellar biogenesis protein FliO
MGILVYVLVKLKSRGPGSIQLPGLPFLKAPPAGATGQQVRILERCGLEARKNLYLVQIFENQYWLVGTTDTQITSLGPVKPPYYTGETSAVSDTTRTFSEYMEDHETTKTTD